MIEYAKAKQMVKELHYIFPYITSRIAFKVLQQSDLSKDDIPTTHTTPYRWLKEFEKVTNRGRKENLIKILGKIL
tara:strand:+ start:115 stop:339 length:225 start_codon:yes stop_codon:yes gene_type:complete